MLTTRQDYIAVQHLLHGKDTNGYSTIAYDNPGCQSSAGTKTLQWQLRGFPTTELPSDLG